MGETRNVNIRATVFLCRHILNSVYADKKMLHWT